MEFLGLGVDLHWLACGNWLLLSLIQASSAGVLLFVAGIGSCSGGSAKLHLGHEHGRSDSGSHSPGGCLIAI